MHSKIIIKPTFLEIKKYHVNNIMKEVAQIYAGLKNQYKI